jgi:hypothetical protein
MKSPEKPLEVARQLDPTLDATEGKTQTAQFISSMVQATVQATALSKTTPPMTESSSISALRTRT